MVRTDIYGFFSLCQLVKCSHAWCMIFIRNKWHIVCFINEWIRWRFVRFSQAHNFIGSAESSNPGGLVPQCFSPLPPAWERITPSIITKYWCRLTNVERSVWGPPYRLESFSIHSEVKHSRWETEANKKVLGCKWNGFIVKT